MADLTQELDPWAPRWLDDGTVGYGLESPAFADPNAGMGPNGLEDPQGDLLQQLAAAEAEQQAQVESQGAIMHPGYDAGPVLQPEVPPFAPSFPGEVPEGPVTHPGFEPEPEPQTVSQMFDSSNPDAVGSMHIETHAEQFSGDPLSNPNQYERDAAIQDMAVNDPAAFMALQVKYQQAAENDAATAALEASANNRLRMEENHKRLEGAHAATAQKMAALDAHYVELSNRKIDPERYMSSRSTGRVMLDLIGAIAGGVSVGQAGGNGPNRYLEDLQRHIDRDIDAQKFDIENGRQVLGARRGLIAEEYARTGDLWQSAEAVRQSLYASIQGDLMAKQQLRDPAGTQSIALGRAVQDMAGRAAAARAAAEAAQFKREMEIAEQLRKNAETAEQIRRNKALEAAAAAKAGTGGGPGKQKARPIEPTRSGYAKKNGIGNWGQDAERAYQEELINVRRSQAAWDQGGAPRPVAASAPGTAPAPVAGPVPAAPQAAPAQAAADAPEPATKGGPKKYTTEDDWFEGNAPLAAAADKKQYWFVDGDNGNDVPPVKLSAIADAEKFAERQRNRKSLGVKVGQLIVLTDRLKKKGFWDRARNAAVEWNTDDDVIEARSLAEEVTGDVITEKGMGVPSGNDVDRVKTMKGGDPAGWKDSNKALQRYRESLQIAQDADWETYAPGAAKDAKYNKYRVLPGAAADWVRKTEGRGAIKIVAPEMGNTDPKQLEVKPVAGDAPDAVRHASDKARASRSRDATGFMRASGYSSPIEPGATSRPALDGPLSLRDEPPRPLPHVDDFTFTGKPEAGAAFAKLRTQFVATAANVDKYLAGDDKYWAGYEKSKRLVADAVTDVLNASGTFYRYVPREKIMTWNKDPELIAKIAGEILRSGGK